MRTTSIDAQVLERILPTVRKPGRYVGGEYNSVTKDWDAVSTRVCLAFPDIYDLGMSNLGVGILYDILNDLPDVLAERAYMPWIDMLDVMRARDIPLYSLESKRPAAAFDILGLSLPSELLYTNALEMLDLAGLPLRASQRDEGHPLVIAGGHAALNPEPMTAFVDAFVIGDGEDVIVELVRAHQATRDASRQAQLQTLARIPGVYVPRLYTVAYHADGTIRSLETASPQAQFPVLRRIVSPLPTPPTRLLVPNVRVTHDRASLEIQRGCTRGCRFCQAGIVTRPVRERPLAEVLQAVERIVSHTGYEEIGLLSLSSSDYAPIEPLVQAINERFAGRHLSISLPALRADSFSVELADAVAQGRHTGFTFAPEAATERLRDAINKPIAAAEMLRVAQQVFQRGWRTVKLYFLIGLPGEQAADVEAIAALSREVLQVGRRAHGRKAQVNVSVNTFIPKPHTPLQWAPLAPQAIVEERQTLLRRQLRGKGLKLSLSDPQETLIETVLARGDRRLSDVIETAWRSGARFDAWGDQRDFGAWEQAFDAHPLDPGFYAYRQREPAEVFPWDVIDVGVERSFLWREYQHSQRGETLVDCRERCHACGILAAYDGRGSAGWRCPPVTQ